MATGLLALLDDIAALVKATAVNLDGISTQVGKTSAKVSGIVIDDAAVTPKYVVGLSPKRELSIIYHIAKKSLFNKIIILAPAALLLGFFVPWVIQPVLMIGGAYLCYEGYEKVHSIFTKYKHANVHGNVGATASPDDCLVISADDLEKMRIDSAVRTDMILSAEIIAIAYATVAQNTIMTQVAVLFFVALAITAVVYGFVGMLVKMDDIGLYLAQHEKSNTFVQRFGRGLVKFMPVFLSVLGYVGTAAMLWVGAEIIAHGVPFLHHALDALKHSLSFSPMLAWLFKAVVCALGGLLIGAMVDKSIASARRIRKLFKG